MIVTMLTLRPAQDRVDDLVAYYGAKQILEVSGAQSAQVLVSLDDPGLVIVTALWSDIEAYASWEASAERLELGRGMTGFFDGSDRITSQRFLVVHDIPPAGAPNDEPRSGRL